MKALSLTQPWAWLVVHGGKCIENRKWNTTFRGEFLIHAAKSAPLAEYHAAERIAHLMPAHRYLDRGGIIGSAQLVEVLAPADNVGPWAAAGQYGFLLAARRPTPFVPCRGMLNFWEVPADVMAALAAAEKEARR